MLRRLQLAFRLAVVGLLLSIFSGCSQSSQRQESTGTIEQAVTLPSGFIEESVAGPWNAAVGLTFSASGRMFVWEKAGKVWEVEADGTRRAQPLLDISGEIGDWRDYGLLGFALHPNFEANGYIYALYVVDYHHLKQSGTAGYDANANQYFVDTIGRVTRYRARATDNFHSVDPASRSVLIGETIDSGFPMLHESHGVGSLVFGQDGSLLVSCGDGASYNQMDPGGLAERPATARQDGIIRAGEDVGAFRSQLVDSLSGKVLRIDPMTGDGVIGNPFYDAQQPRRASSRVWALGLRNPYRMALRPESGSHDPAAADPGTLFIGDVGWITWEELNVTRGPGTNFGWPLFEGNFPHPSYVSGDPGNPDTQNPLFGTTPPGRPFCNQSKFKFADLLLQDSPNALAFKNSCDPSQPVPAGVATFEHTRPSLAWKHGFLQTVVPTFAANGSATETQVGAPGAPPGTPVDGWASTAGVWYTGSDFPSQYANTYFQTDYVGGWIKNLVFDDQDRLTAVRDFSPAGQTPIVMMATNPVTGGLYYVAYGDSVKRIRYVGQGNQPPVATATANVNYGAGPLTVQLNGSSSRDPELGALTYLWDFGDGTPTSTTANPLHVFNPGNTTPRAYTVRLTVTDVGGLSANTTVSIYVNDTPPRVTISQPVNGGLFANTGPTTVLLNAIAVDDEQAAGTLSCSWQAILHHNQHTHVEAAVTGCSQSAHVSQVACDEETYFFEFKVTVTDALGLATTQSSVLYPDCLPRLVVGAATTSSRELHWRPVLGADAYEVEVTDSSGANAMTVQVTPASAGCSDQVSDCVYVPVTPPALGQVSFRVRAHNLTDGWRGWSVPGVFTLTGSSCADGVQNQGETAVDCGGLCPACGSSCTDVLLQPISASASSEESWEFPASKAIDGSMATRWSSAYADPQWISLDLGGLRKLRHVVLRWEGSASSVYDLQVSTSASGPWTTVFHDAAGAGGTKTIAGLNASGRYVRLYSTQRLQPQFGNSLFEFEVYGDVNSSCGACGNGTLNAGEQCDDGNTVDIDNCSNNCLTATCSDAVKNHGETGVDCGGPCAACVMCGDGVKQATEACDDGNTVNDDSCSNSCALATCTDGSKNQGETGTDCGGPCAACSSTCADVRLTTSGAVASTEESWEFPASMAIDGSLGTRWSSAYADPQWLRVDLGGLRKVKRVILRWEPAASANYDIQVSDSTAGPWTTIFHEGAGTSAVKTITGLNASARYVRLYSNARVLAQYGISLFELEVYGDINSGCGTCGNGAPNAGEQCDDGNTVNDDTCNNNCVSATCTDALKNQGETAVDCGGPCPVCVVCGDGVRQGAEQCDDGNAVDTDTCRNNCVSATCTDGIKNQSETATDCGGPCAACVVCGDGVKQGAEACDDGNSVNDDSCSNACVLATCTDTLKNQGETGTDCGGPCAACSSTCADLRLTTSGAVASTEESWEFPASKAIDGSTATRWSSAYADPQWIRVDLGGLRKVKRIILRWEPAASKNYDIQVSDSTAGPWTTIFHEGAGTSAVKTITGLNASARYVRLYSNARVLTQYGISLFELEVYGDVNSGCGTCGNGAANAGEQCDDGNTVNDDTCNNNCFLATCADGVRNQGETAVDCGGPCSVCVVCGDGVRQGAEQCEDGNGVDTDTCRNNCASATCTDGIKNQGETATDCGGPCAACVVCGDGVKAGAEACDDGNTVNDDGCSNGCVLATCTDTIKNQGETGTDCGGPCAACSSTCGDVRLTTIGAAASTEESWEFPASKAIDGSTATRWSSAYADPQWIRVDLGGQRKIKRVILRWEPAASKNYDIQVSDSTAGPWTTVFHEGAGTSAVKTITGLNASARYVRLYSNARLLTQYGISLFEFEVYGDVNSGCGTCGNGVLNAGEQCDDGNSIGDDTCSNNCVSATCTDAVKNQSETGVDCGGTCSACVVCGDGVKAGTEACDDGNTVNDDNCTNSCAVATCTDGAKNHGETGLDCGGPCAACSLVCLDTPLTAVAAVASTEESWEFPASKAIDGSLSTRWSSAYADPQWIRLDLGAARRIKRLILRWEPAASKNYDIQVADSTAGPWTTIFHEGAGTAATKTITGLNASKRYVRLYSNSRVLTQYGISLFEFEVYGDPSPDCGP